MSFPERKSVFHLHPEKSAGLDEICSLRSARKPMGMACEHSLHKPFWSRWKVHEKRLKLLSFCTSSVKQRTPSLVRLPSPIPFFPLGFLPLSLAELGWLREPRERGHFLLLPTIPIICSRFRYFPAHICFAWVPIYTQTHVYTFIRAHTPTLDVHSCTHTCYGDLGPSESASDSFLPCSCISINKHAAPTPFPAKWWPRRVGWTPRGSTAQCCLTHWHHNLKAEGNGWPNWACFDGCVTQLVTAQLLIAEASHPGRTLNTYTAFATVGLQVRLWGLSGLCLVHQSPGHPEAALNILPPLRANPGSSPAPGSCFISCQRYPVPSARLHAPCFSVTNTCLSWTPLLLGRPWVQEQVPVTIDFQAAEVSFSSLSCSWDRPRHLAFISLRCSTLGSKF